MIDAYASAGTIVDAARLAGVGRSPHYDWMRLDEEYSQRFNEAVEDFADAVRNEVRVRAMVGRLEPVVYQGVIDKETGKILLDAYGQPVLEMVAVRKFSDRLIELLAKAKCPEFKDRVELEPGSSLGEILARSCERQNAK